MGSISLVDQNLTSSPSSSPGDSPLKASPCSPGKFIHETEMPLSVLSDVPIGAATVLSPVAEEAESPLKKPPLDLAEDDGDTSSMLAEMSHATAEASAINASSKISSDHSRITPLSPQTMPSSPGHEVKKKSSTRHLKRISSTLSPFRKSPKQSQDCEDSFLLESPAISPSKLSPHKSSDPGSGHLTTKKTALASAVAALAHAATHVTRGTVGVPHESQSKDLADMLTKPAQSVLSSKDPGEDSASTGSMSLTSTHINEAPSCGSTEENTSGLELTEAASLAYDAEICREAETETKLPFNKGKQVDGANRKPMTLSLGSLEGTRFGSSRSPIAMSSPMPGLAADHVPRNPMEDEQLEVRARADNGYSALIKPSAEPQRILMARLRAFILGYVLPYKIALVMQELLTHGTFTRQPALGMTADKINWPLLSILLLLICNWRTLPFVWHIRLWSLVPRYYFARTLEILYAQSYYGSKNEIEILPKLLNTTIQASPFKHQVSTVFGSTYEDCDYHLHLSNSAFSYRLDEARMAWYLHSVFFATDQLKNLYMALGGVSYTFKREVPMLTEYTIDVGIETWDQKWIYLWAKWTTETPKGTVTHCEAICRCTFKIRADPLRRSVPPGRVLSLAGFGPTLVNWKQARVIRASGGHQAALDWLLKGREEKGTDGMDVFEPERIRRLLELAPGSDLQAVKAIIS
ncbi:hypothetical protein E5Q_05166 [Mixia osmundae IAM 14324]|uniref:Uncharacterized protein n=1 Tax=Mixia osmundae (strain CBS 9802 / IAM 14324 / JCM 22182 / KY 12970) TaxID=764103 RepID=G7E6M0_MIXOS|nr:hypothetical protein E5Q_05166 [Mixia osmundae IAM 14324]